MKNGCGVIWRFMINTKLGLTKRHPFGQCMGTFVLVMVGELIRYDASDSFIKGLIFRLGPALVQATADGYVEFAGYGGGYGWMIVISHKFGYKTIYAHLSEIECPTKHACFKGQIIGKIGTGGLSTGPHIHYEILRRRKAVEPTQFLNLDLFTAVSKLVVNFGCD